MRLAKVAVFFLACFSVSRIQASSIVFTLGNVPQPGEENVLLSNGTSGTSVFGETDTSHFSVEFTSTQTLLEPASGQARVEATNGTGQIGLTNINILVPGHTYTDLIFNPDITGTIGVPGGTLAVSVTDSMGQVSDFDYTLGSGSNFLTITAIGGDSIVSTSLQYSLTNGFADLREVRVSGIAAIPEPSTYAPCMGLGLIALIRRRCRL